MPVKRQRLFDYHIVIFLHYQVAVALESAAGRRESFEQHLLVLQNLAIDWRCTAVVAITIQDQ